jgi:hypothetical protein
MMSPELFDPSHPEYLDPLKRARLELTQRHIRREDLGMAIAERQLIREDEHREALAQIVGSVVTFLDTLPDRLERTLSLPGVIVQQLRVAIDSERDSLHEFISEVERNRRGSRLVSVSKHHIAPKTADGETTTATKRKRGRPTNAERAARMQLAN